jgi:hypothetical protein
MDLPMDVSVPVIQNANQIFALGIDVSPAAVLEE